MEGKHGAGLQHINLLTGVYLTDSALFSFSQKSVKVVPLKRKPIKLKLLLLFFLPLGGSAATCKHQTDAHSTELQQPKSSL